MRLRAVKNCRCFKFQTTDVMYTLKMRPFQDGLDADAAILV